MSQRSYGVRHPDKWSSSPGSISSLCLKWLLKSFLKNEHKTVLLWAPFTVPKAGNWLNTSSFKAVLMSPSSEKPQVFHADNTTVSAALASVNQTHDTFSGFLVCLTLEDAHLQPRSRPYIWFWILKTQYHDRHFQQVPIFSLFSCDVPSKDIFYIWSLTKCP